MHGSGSVVSMRPRKEPAPDVSEYLKRVEHAARSLTQASGRISELEETVYDLRQREVTLMVELDQSRMQIRELRMDLDSTMHENQRVTGVLAAAERIIEENGSRLTQMQDSYDTLTRAIDNAFGQRELALEASASVA